MAKIGRYARVVPLALIGGMIATASAQGDESAQGVRQVIVSREDGRFAGWPATNGIWIWGDEILVGFSRGYYKHRGP